MGLAGSLRAKRTNTWRYLARISLKFFGFPELAPRHGVSSPVWVWSDSARLTALRSPMLFARARGPNKVCWGSCQGMNSLATNACPAGENATARHRGRSLRLRVESDQRASRASISPSASASSFSKSAGFPRNSRREMSPSPLRSMAANQLGTSRFDGVICRV